MYHVPHLKNLIPVGDCGNESSVLTFSISFAQQTRSYLGLLIFTYGEYDYAFPHRGSIRQLVSFHFSFTIAFGYFFISLLRNFLNTSWFIFVLRFSVSSGTFALYGRTGM